MKKVTGGLVLMLFSNMAAAETDDEFSAGIQAALKKAKSKQEVEGVLMYCRDKIRAMNYRQHNQAMVAGLKAMEKNDVEEANKHLKLAREIDAMSDNLGAIVCKKR
jgi:hypothetical protein